MALRSEKVWKVVIRSFGSVYVLLKKWRYQETNVFLDGGANEGASNSFIIKPSPFVSGRGVTNR